MSDPCWMSIEIGGDLKKKDVEDFLAAVGDWGFEEGPTTEDELLKCIGKQSIRYAGQTSYGECEDFKAFLENHGLFYEHYYSSNGEYSPSIYCFLPGMKEVKYLESNEENQAMISQTAARRLVDLVQSIGKFGLAALPALATSEYEDIKEIAEKVLTLKNPTLKDLEKRINKYVDKLLPVLPELPPLRII